MADRNRKKWRKASSSSTKASSPPPSSSPLSSSSSAASSSSSAVTSASFSSVSSCCSSAGPEVLPVPKPDISLAADCSFALASPQCSVEAPSHAFPVSSPSMPSPTFTGQMAVGPHALTSSTYAPSEDLEGPLCTTPACPSPAADQLLPTDAAALTVPLFLDHTVFSETSSLLFLPSESANADSSSSGLQKRTSRQSLEPLAASPLYLSAPEAQTHSLRSTPTSDPKCLPADDGTASAIGLKSATEDNATSTTGRCSDGRKRVCFIHLDLGMGGAEQLITHAALGLQRKGHNVTVYTSFFDCDRAPVGTKQLRVVEFGRWIPRTLLFGRFTALMSILRVLYVALRVLWTEGTSNDVIVVDGVSALNPLLYRMTKKLLFYCHFPDLLLCTDRRSAWRRAYRYFLDWYEELSTGFCDEVLVNSKFTKDVFKDTFISPQCQQLEPQIVYPPVDLADVSAFLYNLVSLNHSNFPELSGIDPKSPVFLSLNRFERKKNIQLAIGAFGRLCQELRKSPNAFSYYGPCPVLVIAGGYDPRVAENREYFLALQNLASQDTRFASGQLLFLRSISSHLRWYLMYVAVGVVYTPYAEHFGMVPCEAMAVGSLVIASDSGGPKETVLPDKTGFLCDYDEESFTNAMGMALKIKSTQPASYENMRKTAILHVKNNFSLESFAGKLDSIVVQPAHREKTRRSSK